MDHVVTLIGDPAASKLTPDLADAAVWALTQAGAAAGGADWLAPGVACDIPFQAPEAGGSCAALEGLMRAALGGAPVDIAIQGAGNRRRKLLIADMESTVIQNEMVDELAALVGVHDQVARITERAMNGEIGFRPALRERAALLGGLEASFLSDMCERITFTPGAATLVSTMRAASAYTALVSGGFDVYSAWVADRLGFDGHFANRLLVQDGVVTGQVREPLIGREAKLEVMDRLLAERGRNRDDAIAVGDGANDIDMVGSAGCGIAFHAKAALTGQARFRIEHGDLTALLYIQGYRVAEFSS